MYCGVQAAIFQVETVRGDLEKVDQSGIERHPGQPTASCGQRRTANSPFSVLSLAPLIHQSLTSGSHHHTGAWSVSFAIGDVSGGHINPAVTVAMAWTRNLDPLSAGEYR